MSRSSELSAGRVRQLARRMRLFGWHGTPLAVWRDEIVSDLHRLQAMILARLPDAPVEEITTIFRQVGLDFDTLWRDAGEPEPDTPAWDRLMLRLPARVRREYEL